MFFGRKIFLKDASDAVAAVGDDKMLSSFDAIADEEEEEREGKGVIHPSIHGSIHPSIH